MVTEGTIEAKRNPGNAGDASKQTLDLRIPRILLCPTNANPPTPTSCSIPEIGNRAAAHMSRIDDGIRHLPATSAGLPATPKTEAARKIQTDRTHPVRIRLGTRVAKESCRSNRRRHHASKTLDRKEKDQ